VLRRKVILVAAGVVTALSLAAAGCGGGGEEASQGGGSAASTGAAATTTTTSGPQVLNMAFGAEPPSLDPGLATDTTSSVILLALMDPLVKLGKDLQPVPTLAESWDTSKDGKIVTFHLRQDGKWTNGDPVTAHDFEWSWKRTISPELAADYAYQFFGIVGAADYNACDPKKTNCDTLRDNVGVKALDDYTLQVKLTSPQPWFVQQVTHTSFLAVNRKAVEKWGDKWTEPGHIVTDGPFELTSWKHDASVTLKKWDGWRDAKDVALDQVNGKIIVDGTTAVQAFEAHEIDAMDGNIIPVQEEARLSKTPEYERYPALGTYFYGINVKNVPDVHERRAMALAINRKEIVDKISQAGQVPATGFVPQGMPGFDVINAGGSPWLPPVGDADRAKQEMDKAQNPKRDINLILNDAPGHKEIAVAVQSYWKPLGITANVKVQEWAQFLQFLGPPPNSTVDVYRNGWIGDYVDAINFLETWTCKSGNNNSNWCNKDFDALIEKARATPDDAARYKLYAQAEDILDGKDGEMPDLPFYWYTYPNLERQCVKRTFNINLLDQFDLSKVKVQGDCSK
jgi:ABC-type oligopeptide transport system substrate-binding subunit